MKMKIVFPIILAAAVLSGCATWSTSSVSNKPSNSAAVVSGKKLPSEILVTEKDITGRNYKVLGDISVTVNKTTIFHPDPTPEMAEEKLKEKAAELGADAVIHVTYGKVKMSLMSYGSLEGKGRAIKFEE